MICMIVVLRYGKDIDHLTEKKACFGWQQFVRESSSDELLQLFCVWIGNREYERIIMDSDGAVYEFKECRSLI